MWPDQYCTFETILVSIFERNNQIATYQTIFFIDYCLHVHITIIFDKDSLNVLIKELQAGHYTVDINLSVLSLVDKICNGDRVSK